MCYEFIHSCETGLKTTLGQLLQPGQYFLVCIGEIHYLFCNNSIAMRTLKTHLLLQGIRLFSLPPEELLSVVDFPGMNNSQGLHGDSSLLEALRTKTGRVKLSTAA